MILRAVVSAGLVTVAGFAAASTADARVVSTSHFVNALMPNRIQGQIGFLPIVGMQRLGAVSIRAGGNTYRGEWINSLAGRLSTTQALKEIRRYGNYSYSLYADRKLTSAERRSFDVLFDIGRDADVLVVQAGHPACAGLTLAQTRGIASGKITNWSAIGGSGPIVLRHTVMLDTYEPRFGVAKKPAAAKGRADGGLADAAGDPSVAAITSWSRARFHSDVCAVPIDGVQPTNTTVHSLSYKAAYPVSFVAAKKRRHDAYSKAMLKYYVNFLKSPAATKVFRGTGMLLTAEKPGDAGGGNNAGGPTRDAQGRTITPIRDDAGARAALEGNRLQQSRDPGYIRMAFEANGIVNLLDSGDGTTCSSSPGTWSVTEAWRYNENGGGYVIHAQVDFGDGPRAAAIELANDPPGFAYYNGDTWQQSRGLAGSC